MSLAQLEDDGRLVNMAICMCVVREGIEIRGHDQIASSLKRSAVGIETRNDASSIVKHLELAQVYFQGCVKSLD